MSSIPGEASQAGFERDELNEFTAISVGTKRLTPVRLVSIATASLPATGRPGTIYATENGWVRYAAGSVGLYVALDAADPIGPVNTVLPAISGTTTEGQTLTCSSGTWTGDATITYTYQWKRGGVAIGGATAATRVLATADVGALMTCTVTASNHGGTFTASATSAATVAIVGL